MDSERMPIDFFMKNDIVIGSIICIYGTYYPISYWYVHNIDDDLLTLIKLSNDYLPLLLEPEMIQIEKHLIHFYITSQFNNLFLPSNYFQTYYQNRIIKKKQRYGDFIHIKNNFNHYDLFRVLNYDPISGSYLCFDCDYSNHKKNYSRNHSIILNLSDFSVVSTKELRCELLEKSKQIKLSIKNSNFERLDFLDDMILFKNIMNYIEEKSNQYNIRLNELGFLNGQNNEEQPLEDLIKFDSLQLEDEYNPEYNDNYNWINNVIDRAFCAEINGEETSLIKEQNHLITSLTDNDTFNFQNCKVYNYWQTDNICGNYLLDEALSYNDYRDMIVPYTEDSSFSENDNYCYKDDLINLYDTDEEVDLKNMDTFSISRDIKELICNKNNTNEIVNEDSNDVVNEDSNDIIDGKSFSTSYDTDTENLDQTILEIINIDNNTVVKNVEEIDEYVKLEKDDFEPFIADQACSIM